MKAERFFRGLIYADTQIDADLAEIEKLRTLMNRIPGDNTELEKLKTKFRNLENHIAEEIDELVNLENDAREVLVQIENPQQRIVLQEYYINRKSLEAISARLYINYRRVQEIKQQGLRAAQHILDTRGRNGT